MGQLNYDEWETIVNGLRLHLLAASSSREAMDVSQELRAWLDMEPEAAAGSSPAECAARLDRILQPHTTGEIRAAYNRWMESDLRVVDNAGSQLSALPVAADQDCPK